MYAVPIRIALNRTTWSQTKACIARLSCEICTPLRYYTACFGTTYRSHFQGSRNPNKRTLHNWI